MSNVRVRFAPSPTGHLHIGGVRTALFNYLYAKNQNGEFLLRIEDTDRERSKPEFEEEILSGLHWLGLHWDGEAERQTDRLTLYKESCEGLIAKGLAYPDPKGTRAVYFKVPKKKIKFFDLIHDETEFDTNLFDDFVIVKSDSIPTYLFACVVDDAEMKISHVIRGDDHLTNTARQLLIYEALAKTPPKFAHLPLILNPEGKPLSKREGGGSLNFYIEEGFLPDGLLNYLALLGWGPGGNEEFFTKEQLVKKFSLKRVNKTPAALNLDKLRYINGLHLKKLPPEEYAQQVKVFYKREVEDETAIPEEDFVACALMYQDRIKTFRELLEEGKYFFEEDIARDPEAAAKYLTDEAKGKLKAYGERLETADFSSISHLETHLRETADVLGVRAADLIHPLRVALTGKAVSPGIFDVMKLLGKNRTLHRIQEVYS
jgi:glutamyl-tRNA synthetase